MQHITPEMLNELSREAKERLRDWWKPRMGDKYIDIEGKAWRDNPDYDWGSYCISCDDLHEPSKRYLPLLSIGGCIELLDERGEGWWRLERSTRRTHWRVNDENTDYDLFGDPELIRALWDAAKALLEAGDCPEWKEEKP